MNVRRPAVTRRRRSIMGAWCSTGRAGDWNRADGPAAGRPPPRTSDRRGRVV